MLAMIIAVCCTVSAQTLKKRVREEEAEPKLVCCTMFFSSHLLICFWVLFSPKRLRKVKQGYAISVRNWCSLLGLSCSRTAAQQNSALALHTFITVPQLCTAKQCPSFAHIYNSPSFAQQNSAPALHTFKQHSSTAKQCLSFAHNYNSATALYTLSNSAPALHTIITVPQLCTH